MSAKHNVAIFSTQQLILYFGILVFPFSVEVIGGQDDVGLTLFVIDHGGEMQIVAGVVPLVVGFAELGEGGNAFFFLIHFLRLAAPVHISELIFFK